MKKNKSDNEQKIKFEQIYWMITLLRYRLMMKIKNIKQKMKLKKQKQKIKLREIGNENGYAAMYLNPALPS